MTGIAIVFYSLVFLVFIGVCALSEWIMGRKVRRAEDRRCGKQMRRRIAPYTMRSNRFSVELLGVGEWPSNVVALDTFSRKVDAA